MFGSSRMEGGQFALHLLRHSHLSSVFVILFTAILARFLVYQQGTNSNDQAEATSGHSWPSSSIRRLITYIYIFFLSRPIFSYINMVKIQTIKLWQHQHLLFCLHLLVSQSTGLSKALSARLFCKCVCIIIRFKQLKNTHTSIVCFCKKYLHLQSYIPFFYEKKRTNIWII